jgi:hypothetical protein
MNDLPLQIAVVDIIVVGYGDVADAAGSQIKGDR